jgi:predicted peptidase
VPPPAPTGTYTPLPATFTPTLLPSPFPSTWTPTPTLPPQPGQHPFTSEVSLIFTNGDSQVEKVRYLLYLPEAYFADPAKQWPLILFLHGSGEAGADLKLLERTGLPEVLKNDANFPFVVVSPQIPAPPPGGDASSAFDVQNYLATWGWKPHIRKLEALLVHLQSSLRIDPQRLYLTGLSLGGFGAWEYALEFPDRFAAVVPLAGGFRFVDNKLPANLCDLKDLPIWAFHGKLDGTVFPERAQGLVDGLKACGSTVARLTLYPDLGHNISSTAYADAELWEWLLAQEKN